MARNPQNALELEARALRAWAEARHLFHSLGGSTQRTPAGAGRAAVEMFSAEAAETLSRKPITAVGMNRNKGEKGTITVYTARPLNAAEKAELIDSYDREAAIEFDVAKPPVLDPGAAAGAPPAALERRWSRYSCGSSISQANVREAGTLGCLVRDREGRLFGLTANHVTGGCSNAKIGSPISAPGIKDVGAGQPDPRTIGHHQRSAPFAAGDPGVVDATRNADAAIFSLVDPAEVSSWQGDFFDTPSIVADPEEGALVEKVGRTTRRTRGVIESQIIGSHPVSYRTTVHHSSEETMEFRATVYFEPAFLMRGRGRPFAAAGDSGALVVQIDDNGERTAVGMLFCGSGTNTSYMLPLRPLLEAMELTLVSGHNPPEIP